MIVLHNLRGEQFALNAELIERVEGVTETHVTLVTGTNYVVQESEEEVIRLHRLDRAEVQVLAGQVFTSSTLESSDAASAIPLRLVEPRDDEGRDRP